MELSNTDMKASNDNPSEIFSADKIGKSSRYEGLLSTQGKSKSKFDHLMRSPKVIKAKNLLKKSNTIDVLKKLKQKLKQH